MEQNTENIQAKKGCKRPGCWIAGCLTALFVSIAFVGIIVAIAFWATSGMVDVINEQLTFLRNGDIENAYLLTSGEFRKVTDLAGFKRFISTNSSLANNADYSFLNREFKNNIGYVEGSLITEDGTRTPIKYHLVKENGKWKILYIGIPQSGIEIE